MIARRVLIGVLALLLAAQVVREAAVTALADTQPASAARLWAGHPAVELSLAMTEIAAGTRAGKPLPPSVFKAVEDAAKKAPLAPDPFLIRGVRAQLASDPRTAERAFAAAQWRDPRSLPAAYFLADHYFRTGDAPRGIRQVAALSRLAPATQNIAPYVAAYAQDRRNWPQLRTLFRLDPQIGDQTLAALAADVANLDVILALAEPRQLKPTSGWVEVLLTNLVAKGEYRKARALWARVSQVRVPPGELLFDPGFTATTPPPPFNWTLASSTVGLAERQGGGRLHILFYGQADGVLASQLLLLPPGSYRLSMQLLGEPARARVLGWSIRCDKSQTPLATVTLDAAAAQGWTFRVPTNCPAQWLELSGSSSDMPQQSDVTVTALSLKREGAGG